VGSRESVGYLQTEGRVVERMLAILSILYVNSVKMRIFAGIPLKSVPFKNSEMSFSARVGMTGLFSSINNDIILTIPVGISSEGNSGRNPCIKIPFD